MFEILGLDLSAKMLIYLMLSLSFFVGIILMVSREAFSALHKALQKEYGIKRRLAPKFEDSTIDFIDRVLIKHRVVAGAVISITSFFLLLWLRV